jgi:hypothetical protein
MAKKKILILPPEFIDKIITDYFILGEDKNNY